MSARHLLLLLLPACLAACASVETIPAPPPQGAAAEQPGNLAKIEVQFVPDPARIAPHLEEDQDFMSPHPIVTHLPQFPPGHTDITQPVVVVLRFIVGETGAVRDVEDSPLRDPAAPAGDPAFRQAAEDAVLGWLFVPAAIRTVKPGADLDHDSQPDYTVLVDSQRIPVYLDVRFTFEIIEGEGRVRID